MSDTLVVSYFTDDRYRRYAVRLAQSCETHGFSHSIIKLPDQGRWVMNVAMKGSFIHLMMQKHERPLLWIDADAEIVNGNEVRNGLLELSVNEYDFAIRGEPCGQRYRAVGWDHTFPMPTSWPPDLRPRRFNTGTMWFNQTDGAKRLVKLWRDRAIESPRSYQQHLLQTAWADANAEYPIKTKWWPQSWCRIERMHKKTKPLINHRLASTEFKVNRR